MNGSRAPVATAILTLAERLLLEARLTEAESLIERVLQQEPGNADTLHLSAVVCDRRGDDGRTLQRLWLAIGASPANSAYFNSLGIFHSQRGRDDEAVAAFGRAVEFNPGHFPARRNVAGQLAGAGRFDDAAMHLHELVRRDPGSVELIVGLAGLMSAQCRQREAAGYHARALEIDPADESAQNGQILDALYDLQALATASLEVCLRHMRRRERVIAAPSASFSNEPDPHRRLKMGYVSADFGRHSVANFIESILACHDHANFEVFCDSCSALYDPMRSVFKPSRITGSTR